MAAALPRAPRVLRSVRGEEAAARAPKRRGSPHDCTLNACERPAAYVVTVPDKRMPVYACRYHLVTLIDRVDPTDLSVVVDRIQR